MTLATISAYALALFVVALIPGPGITALVARALGTSFRESVAMALGIALGDLAFLTAVVLGLSVVAQTFGVVFVVIKYAGAAYLAWMAYTIWTSGIVHQDTIRPAGRASLLQAMVSGLFVSLGNPKVMLFYLALVPTIIDIATVAVSDYLILLGVSMAVLLIVTIPYIVLAAKARELLRHPAALKRLNRASATFLAGTAGYIAMRS